MILLLASTLAFLGLVLFATAQFWLGARLIRAEKRGWGRAATAALICIFLSLPVSMLVGNGTFASVVQFLVGAVVIQRVLVTTMWRALGLSLVLLMFNLALALLLSDMSLLRIGAV